jgi:hypothetical protein
MKRYQHSDDVELVFCLFTSDMSSATTNDPVVATELENGS